MTTISLLASALLGALGDAPLAFNDSTTRSSPGSGAPLVVATAAPASKAPAKAAKAPAPRRPSSLAVPASRATNADRRHFGVADSITVEKAAHRLTLYRDGVAVVSYSVALGQNPTGHKERAGDQRTPEGLYHIDGRNPGSRFHLGLHVSYPNAADRARARQLGVATGGDIMIHGLPNGQGSVGAAHRQYDWTNGCVAVTDEEIEEIWESVPVGTPIRILP